MPDEPKKKSRTGPESRPVLALLEELGKYLTQDQKSAVYDVLETSSRNLTRRDDGYRLICERLIPPLGRKWDGFRRLLNAAEVNAENEEPVASSPSMDEIVAAHMPPVVLAKIQAKDLKGAMAGSLNQMLARGKVQTSSGIVQEEATPVFVPKAYVFENALRAALTLPQAFESYSVESIPLRLFRAGFSLGDQSYNYVCAVRREGDEVPKTEGLWEEYGFINLEHTMNGSYRHEGVADITSEEMPLVVQGAIVRHSIKGKSFVLYCYPVGKRMLFKFWLRSQKLHARGNGSGNIAERFFVVDPSGKIEECDRHGEVMAASASN